MKNKKYIYFTAIILFIILGIIIKQQQQKRAQIVKNASEKSVWKKITKVSPNKITHTELSKEELAKARLSNAPGPAKNNKQQKVKMFYKNKKVIGVNANKWQQLNFKTLEFINEDSNAWEDKLSSKLLLYSAKNSDVYIKKVQSLLKITYNKAQFLEEVVVRVIDSQGKSETFAALIDSQSGMIISKWGSEIRDNLGTNKKGVSASPMENE